MTIKYHVRKQRDGALVGWSRDESDAVSKARWLATAFNTRHVVVRLSDGAIVHEFDKATVG